MESNQNQSKYIGKFRFNTETNQCWWLKENGEEYKVPKENKGMGTIAYQNYFILEKENNPAHWVNYQITHSGGKLWLNSWYKKVIKVEDKEQINQYKVKVEKLTDIVEIDFKEEDEMVKEWNERKQKEVWVKKNKGEKKPTDDKAKKEVDDLNNL